jgi:hypothetical protein
MFCSAGYSLLRAEGFFYSLDVLSGVLGKGKLWFLIQNKNKIFFRCKSFPIFGHQKPGSGSGLVFKIKILVLDPDPDPYQMNTDPKHCYCHCVLRIS